jgi:glycine/D-amino acid oxidase-like deaminating enzyme
LTRFAAGQRAVGVRADVLDADALAQAEPYVTGEHTAALYYPEDAQVQPAGAAAALLGDALAAGATLRTGCEVLGALGRGGRITGVRASAGLLEADWFVNAVRPWSG